MPHFAKEKNLIQESDEGALEMIVVEVLAQNPRAVEDIKNSGVKIKDIKTFPGATETFSALKANQADVIVTDEAVGFDEPFVTTTLLAVVRFNLVGSMVCTPVVDQSTNDDELSFAFI